MGRNFRVSDKNDRDSIGWDNAVGSGHQDFDRSNTRVVRKRMVLDVFDTDPRVTQEAVFWFGSNDQFMLMEYIFKHGQQEQECTKIFIQGREFRVIQKLETINDFLFGEY